jgi:hypothetical protein
MNQQLHIGAPSTIESYAERAPYGAVFEDDGKVAYFYAVDTRSGDRGFLDAVCVYEVWNLINHPTPELDAYRAYDIRIVWSEDQRQVALLLDGYPHAAFDFDQHRAYCRSNFPSGSSWSPAGHAWDAHAVDFLSLLTDEIRQPNAKHTGLP